MRPAATWILTNSDGRILLLQRNNYNHIFPYYWTLPAGRWESWEKPEEIIIREVFEETGLKFEPIKLQYEYHTKNGEQDVHDHWFLWKYSGEIQVQKEEVKQFGWFSYKETQKLQIAFHYREIIDTLYKEKLIT